MVIPSGSIHEPALELRSGWYDVIVLITTGTYTQIELVDNKDPDTLDLTRTKIWANYGVVHRCFASLVRLCKHPTSTDDVYKEPVQFYSPTRLVADDIVLQEPYLTNSTGSQSSTVQKMEFGFFSMHQYESRPDSIMISHLELNLTELRHIFHEIPSLSNDRKRLNSLQC